MPDTPRPSGSRTVGTTYPETGPKQVVPKQVGTTGNRSPNPPIPPQKWFPSRFPTGSGAPGRTQWFPNPAPPRVLDGIHLELAPGTNPRHPTCGNTLRTRNPAVLRAMADYLDKWKHA